MKGWIIIALALLLVVLLLVLLRRTSGLTSGASTCTACPAKTAGTYYTSINGCATAACSTSAACPATENGTSYLPDGSCVDATQSQPNGFSGAGSCQYSCNPGYVNYAPYTCRLATPTDPRSTVWSTGQMIQSAPVVISVPKPPAPTNQPSGLIAGGSVSSYTISLDLYYSGKQWSDWFGILEMGAYPAVWLTPRTAEGVGAFGVQTVPGSGYLDTNNVRNVPVNTWFNLVAVYNAATGTCSLYYNGTNVASSTPLGAIWPSPLPRMVFNSRGHTETTVAVTNIYWWNSALSDAQAAQLVIPAAR